MAKFCFQGNFTSLFLVVGPNNLDLPSHYKGSCLREQIQMKFSPFRDLANDAISISPSLALRVSLQKPFKELLVSTEKVLHPLLRLEEGPVEQFAWSSKVRKGK